VFVRARCLRLKKDSKFVLGREFPREEKVGRPLVESVVALCFPTTGFKDPEAVKEVPVDSVSISGGKNHFFSAPAGRLLSCESQTTPSMSTKEKNRSPPGR